MRKLVIAILALLVPFSMYAAGCRRDSQAAFPGGPEMKNLASARSLESAHPTIPVIPAQPKIDPEVMQSPDHPTFARLQAVRDQEARLAANYAPEPGLFVLPRDHGQPHMAALPAQPFLVPAPRTFAHPQALDTRLTMQPEQIPGVYAYQPERVIPTGARTYEPLPEPVPVLATAPVPAGPEFWSRPVVSYQEPAGMPIPHDIQAMRPSAPRLPVIPDSPPAEPVPPDSLLLPESIPGMFFGPDSADNPLVGVVPLGRFDTAGDTPPPALSSVVPPAPPAELMTAPPAPILTPAPLARAKEPEIRMSLVDLLQIAGAPVPDKAVAVNSVTNNEELRRALEPLASLAEPEFIEGPPMPPPDLFGSQAISDFSEALLRASREEKAEVDNRDLYRMDFWNEKLPVPGKERQEMKAVTEPVQADTSKSDKSTHQVEAATPPEPAEEAPQKVQLQPLVPLRFKSLNAIDAEVAPPPVTL